MAQMDNTDSTHFTQGNDSADVSNSVIDTVVLTSVQNVSTTNAPQATYSNLGGVAWLWRISFGSYSFVHLTTKNYIF